MPIVFGCFAISSLGLMGVPGFAGFISKWNLAQAAVESKNVLAYVGIVALLVSALLTAIYMLHMMARAFFPKQDFDYKKIENVKDPTWKMCLPLILCAIATVLLGFCSQPLVKFLGDIAAGLY